MNESLNPFKYKYKGKSVMLFAPGPTLNDYDISVIPDGFYKAGINGVILHEDFRNLLDIYVWSGDLDTVEHPQPGSSKIYEQFYKLKGVDKFVCCYTNGGFHYPGFREPTQVHPTDIPSNAVAFNQTVPKNWNPDIVHHGLDGNSVAFQALQILLFMGFTEIHLVGFDCGGKHSYHDIVDGDVCDWGDGTNVTLVSLWRELKQTYLKTYYPDVKVYSINPVGLKGLFLEL